jgi:hypothetical protein
MNTKFDISQFSPCSEGKGYYDSKATAEDAWRDCERGEWMLWIAHKLDIDRRTLTRAKALCANTVRHLMNKRSTDAIDAALQYADGKITEKELDDAASRASAAADVAHAHAHADVVYADAYAAYAAARAAAAVAADDDDDVVAASAASAAYVAYAYDAYDAAYDATHAATHAATRAIEAAIEATNAATAAEAAARKANQLQTANICREVLTEAVFKKIKKIQNKG